MDSINDIINNLSSDDIDMLKGVAASIMGEAPSNNQSNKSNVNNTNTDNNQSPFSNMGINQNDLNMILKAKAMFEKMKNNPSNNANLIMALKPHLSEENQEKADKAVRIMQIFEMLPLIKEFF